MRPQIAGRRGRWISFSLTGPPAVGEGRGSVIHPHGRSGSRIGAVRTGYASLQGRDRCISVIHANPRGPADISRIGVGCDGTAKLHGQGKLISAIHRHTRHAMEAHGRPASVEGGKEMCPPARSDPVPGPWKAYARRRWISIPLHAQGLLSLSPTGNVNYTRKPAGRIPGSESEQKRKTAEMTVFS